MNRFITFEGIDGSGKTTQIEMLKSKLSAKGEKVVSFREPGGTKISETIRRILLSNQNSNLTDASEALLFFASRSQLLVEKITPFLEKEIQAILINRYESKEYIIEKEALSLQGQKNSIDLLLKAIQQRCK